MNIAVTRQYIAVKILHSNPRAHNNERLCLSFLQLFGVWWFHDGLCHVFNNIMATLYEHVASLSQCVLEWTGHL